MNLHFYDETTGIFTGASFSATSSAARPRIPAGCKAYEGIVDYLSQRVDVETGDLVDYVPPQPNSDHEWNAQRRRWQKRAEVVDLEQRKAAARHRIAELEASQLRAMRELTLRPTERDTDGALAHERLQAIDDEIVTLRAVISDGMDTSAP